MDTVSEHEDRFRAIAEKRIRDAMESGEFTVRTGPGERLDLDDNPYIPEDMRLAFRVLKSNHIRPDWMDLAGEIDGDLDGWRRAADRHFAFIRERLDAVVASPTGIRRLREEVATLKLRHQRATAYHAQQIEEINRKIHRYNATVPTPSLMRGTLPAGEEMRRFADRLPAYLNY